MNIAIFTDTFLPKIDGVGISTARFSRMMAERGHTVTICCPAYGADDFELMGERVRIVRLKGAPLPSYPDIRVALPSRKKIHSVMNSPPADLVHIQTPGFIGQYGVMAARMNRTPHIGTYHTLLSEQEMYMSLYRLLKADKILDYFRRKKKIRKRLDRVERKKGNRLKKKIIDRLCKRIYDSGKLILAPSECIKIILENQDYKTPIEVLSNGIELKRFRSPTRTAPHDLPRLLHIGRISHEKNCEVVLKAFALISEARPGATLDIIGDGPSMNSLRIEARQLNIHENVRFLGFMPRDELPALYPNYDLFLTASAMETQGLAVLEAMAAGMPIIGVDAFALPELIRNDINGYVVPPFDHIAMAEKALQILANPSLFSEFAEASLHIAEKHDIETCADRLEEIYRKNCINPT